MSLALGDVSVRMLLRGMSEIFLPMFSSRTFMVLRLIFKSFIHLEFIFMCGVSWWKNVSFFVCVAVQLSQHHLLKRLFLFHFMLLPRLSNINWPQRHELSILFHWSIFFMRLPGCFDYGGLVIHFDIRYCDPSCFVVLSQNCCSYMGSFILHINFWNVCSISVEYVIILL